MSEFEAIDPAGPIDMAEALALLPARCRNCSDAFTLIMLHFAFETSTGEKPINLINDIRVKCPGPPTEPEPPDIEGGTLLHDPFDAHVVVQVPGDDLPMNALFIRRHNAAAEICPFIDLLGQGFDDEGT